MIQPKFRLHRYVSCIVFLLFLTPVLADMVVLDDQIVDGSLCVGGDCVDGEVFDFDTIKIKSSDPQIKFQDTSSSASFPTNDWLMGIADDMATGSAFFYITDVESGSNVLHIQAADTGGVALGAGSEVVFDAVSVGAPGAERPIVNVASGINDTDAVNVEQFDDFQQQTESDNAGAISAIESDIAATQVRIDDLQLRIHDLVHRVDILLTWGS